MTGRVGEVIGYYVHHHGAGHGMRASALARRAGRRVVGLGSGPRPADWDGDWVALRRDDEEPITDPARDGAWHWLPRSHRGLTARQRAVATWIAGEAPAAFVSDVSCEITVLAELLGVPTVHILLHGDRRDRPHRLAFDTATCLAAPWPSAHAEDAHGPWSPKVRHLGLLSRYDHLAPPSHAGDGSVLVLIPGGSHPFGVASIVAAARASGRRWVVAGRVDAEPPSVDEVDWLGPADDVWRHLVRSSVVVAAAGNGSIGDAAAARRPAILFPQPRPFDEQLRAAEALRDRAPVRVGASWPDTDWKQLVDATAALDGSSWSALHDRCAGERFATLLDRVAGEETVQACSVGGRQPTMG